MGAIPCTSQMMPSVKEQVKVKLNTECTLIAFLLLQNMLADGFAHYFHAPATQAKRYHITVKRENRKFISEPMTTI